MRTKVWRTVGEYNEAVPHFELEYARKYVDQRYKTCFLHNLNCLHIGRRTYERFNLEMSNAYELDCVNQFAEPNLDTLVLNLACRPDRWQNFEKKNCAILKKANLNYAKINTHIAFCKTEYSKYFTSRFRCSNFKYFVSGIAC